jgi:hypothetical protein
VELKVAREAAASQHAALLQLERLEPLHILVKATAGRCWDEIGKTEREEE